MVLFLSREKAELFKTVHDYELKLVEEQSRKWMADEDVLACTKCLVQFGWTVRKASERDLTQRHI
jgi:hypothetical protein